MNQLGLLALLQAFETARNRRSRSATRASEKPWFKQASGVATERTENFSENAQPGRT
jgi:hypothetical protein